MELRDVRFLEGLKASLENRRVDWKEDISPQEIMELIQMSDIHNVVPMIYEAIYELPVMGKLHSGLAIQLRRGVIQSIAMQAMKTEEFQQLYTQLCEDGLKPCVVKGIICRNLYPNPDARMSWDEDILIPWDSFPQAHAAMLSHDMVLSDPKVNLEQDYEIPYGKMGSPIYIELHKSLFPPKSEAYGNLNDFFKDIHDRLVTEEIQGTTFYTMNPTDHLFYLICHSFKHFLHSGFGLRQVCDINLYANAYGSQIKWDEVLEKCQEIRADLFAASMFRIGEKYLTFNPEKACYPEEWSSIEVDENAMLEDLLESGVYGQSDMSRKHSSNITLNAVIADKRGKKAKAGIASSIFLPVRSLEGRFPYLKKYPFLLPFAWVQRIWIYRKETAKNQSGNNAAESIKIGNQRVELMKIYGIIK